MSEENKPKRTVHMKLDRKFGVSEERRDTGFRGPDSRVAGDRPRGGKPRGNDYRDRSAPASDRGERKSFGDRPSFDRGERKSFGDRPSFDRGERKSFGDRPSFDRGERKSFGDKPAFDRGERKSFGDKPSFDRGPRKSYGDKPSFNRGERRVWTEEERQANAPVFRQRPVEAPAEFPEEVVLPETPEAAEAMAAEKDPPWFRRLLALLTEKGREREEKFLAEGVRVVTEMVEYHSDIVQGIYAVEGFNDTALLDKARAANLRVHDLTAEQMARLSSTVHGPGIVASCRTASRKPDYDRGRMLTLVDAVQDPGNLGALFRTSLGFSSSGMLLGKGTVDPFNPKVVRGSSGTFLRVPFEHGVDLAERVQFLRQKGYCIVATDLHAKQSLADISPRKLRKVALIMGNEGMGAEKGLLELADEWVRIPMGESLESLNVTVAHGILSFQLAQLQEAALSGK